MVELYANVIVSGLLVGAVYALIATGLTILFGVMRVVNFAHGEMVVIGMYLGYWMVSLVGTPIWLVTPLATAALFGLGYGLQRGIVNRVMGQPQHMQFILFIALALIITGLHTMLFGPDPRGMGSAASFEVYRLGALRIDAPKANAALVALALMACLGALLRWTTLGKSIRGCAANRMGAEVVGLRVPHLFALTAGIGAAAAGAAGALVAPLFDTHPYLAPEFTLLAFIIVIVGGLGSLSGAFLGGITIGVAESLAAITFMPSLKSLFSYGLLILILLVRPQGIFGVQEAP